VPHREAKENVLAAVDRHEAPRIQQGIASGERDGATGKQCTRPSDESPHDQRGEGKSSGASPLRLGDLA
jgi:hypothetical protein